MKLFPIAAVSLLCKNLIFSLFTEYFMTGILSSKFWLIWATFLTEHLRWLLLKWQFLFHQNFLYQVMIWEMFLRKTFHQQCRSSRPPNFFKISALIRFPILTRKYVFESFSNKVTSLKGCNFIKKGPQHRCFLVNITQCLRIRRVTRGGGGRSPLPYFENWKKVP